MVMTAAQAISTDCPKHAGSGLPSGALTLSWESTDWTKKFETAELLVLVSGWPDPRFLSDLEEQRTDWRSKPPANIRGDCAIAIWDKVEARVWLCRTPLCSRPLYFRRSEGGRIEISPLSQRLAGSAPTVEEGALIRWYGALASGAVDSMFREVTAVPAGAVVCITPGNIAATWSWSAASMPSNRGIDDERLAEGLRQSMEEAVERAIATGPVGSMLSAGRDSGIVSALAARALERREQRLACFTASPGLEPQERSLAPSIDEQDGAAAVAAMYPNIDHYVITPRNVPFCAEVEAIYRVHSVPLGNPISLYWWIGIQRAAASLGCKTLLGGAMGNLTVSAGGPSYLADILSNGDWSGWLCGVRDAARFEGASWRNLLNISVGGYLPRPLYRAAQIMADRRARPALYPFLRDPLRADLMMEHESQDQRPPRSTRRRVEQMLTEADLGDVSAERLFGLSLRDPTADRCVVEASLRIPAGRLASRYDLRPIFELAFRDLLPNSTIRSPQRGVQSTDWNRAYCLDDLKDGLQRYEAHRLVRQWMNLPEMKGALDRWPVDRQASPRETSELGHGLLRAFALAAFLHVNIPG